MMVIVRKQINTIDFFDYSKLTLPAMVRMIRTVARVNQDS